MGADVVIESGAQSDDARLEFATQPFDLPRAEVLRHGPLFDSPVFRILPATSTITSTFLMFYTTCPKGS